jgi:ribosomal protein S18 acetylase RimI-like enzyme
MLRVFLNKKISAFRNARGSIGLRRLLRNLTYLCHEEIIITKHLDKVANLPVKDRLQIDLMESKDLESIASLRKESGGDEIKYLETLWGYWNNHGSGLIARSKGDLVSYLWWGNNKMGCSPVDLITKFYMSEIRFCPIAIYMFDVYVARKYRKSGIATALLMQFFLILRNLGYQRVLAYVLSTNMPARRLYKLLGFEETKKVRVRRIMLFIVLRNNKIYFDKYGRMAIWTKE